MLKVIGLNKNYIYFSYPGYQDYYYSKGYSFAFPVIKRSGLTIVVDCGNDLILCKRVRRYIFSPYSAYSIRLVK